MLEIGGVALLAVGLLSIWLVKGRILVFTDGGTSASARTGIAAHTIHVMRVWVAKRAGAPEALPVASSKPARLAPTGPVHPLPPVQTEPLGGVEPLPQGTSAAPSATGLTPPPGGWEYPPELIYEEVERERRRQRELEEAERRRKGR